MKWALWFKTLFFPPADHVGLQEKALSALGGFGGIFLIMWVSQFFLAPKDLPWVVASMGASAVLLFAVPMGPLSQPWSLLGGHLLSGLVGVTVAYWVPDLVWASALAVSLAIFVMYVSRCLHPPGGATALTVVAGGESIRALGYDYLLTPVLINALVMLAWALFINNLLPNRCYPNGLRTWRARKQSPVGEDKVAGDIRIRREDLEYALREMHEFIDVSEEDLSRIFRISAGHARRRRMGELYVSDIMSQPPIYAEYGDSVEDLWKLMQTHRIRGIPIVDQRQHVIGIVTIADFLNQVANDDHLPLRNRMRQFLRRSTELTTTKPEYAGHLMSKPAITIRQNQHILDLFPIFYRQGVHHLPVVDDANRLVGMVTPKDLLAALHAEMEGAA